MGDGWNLLIVEMLVADLCRGFVRQFRDCDGPPVSVLRAMRPVYARIDAGDLAGAKVAIAACERLVIAEANARRVDTSGWLIRLDAERAHAEGTC
jgi:hypothetical protein